MASRQNTIFSLPLLVFMVGAVALLQRRPNFGDRPQRGQERSSTCSSGIVVLVVLEVNALGKISGRGNSGLNVIYETHKNAMYTGFASDRRVLHPRRDPAPKR